MNKNFYIEENSGKFNDYDYFISADVDDDGVTTITAFLNHRHIHFADMISDFKCMLCSLESRYEKTDYDFVETEVNSDSRVFNIDADPNEHEVIINIYDSEFDRERLIESFAYSVGYVQSFMIHSYDPDTEDSELEDDDVEWIEEDYDEYDEKGGDC